MRVASQRLLSKDDTADFICRNNPRALSGFCLICIGAYVADAGLPDKRDVTRPDERHITVLEDQMRNTRWLIGCGLLASMGLLLVDTATAQERKVMFNNEQVTLACQQYVNSLYPAGQGSSDREREAVFRACLARGGN